MAVISKVNVPDTSPVLIVAANGNRKCVAFVNRGTDNVYISKLPDVSTTTGLTIRMNSSIVFNGDPDEFYGIAASGTQSIEIVEVI